MKRVISALLSLLLLVSVCGLTACGENEIKTATEIKELLTGYEPNIENANFSKFTLSSRYADKREYNHSSIDDVDEFRDFIISYDESGYLYYKNRESENAYTEMWLYTDGTDLILASNNHEGSQDTKRYDTLEFNSFEAAHASFLEEAPRRINKFVDWFNYQSSSIHDIPKKYCEDYLKTASNLCERVINELAPYLTVSINDGTVLKVIFSDDQEYTFENGLIKQYDNSSSGTRQFDKYGVGKVTETYESAENISLSISCDSNKPDLSSFEKIYH